MCIRDRVFNPAGGTGMGPMVADRRFGSGGARPTGCGWWFTGRRVAAADDPVIGHPRTLLIFLGAEVCACVQPAKTWSTWVLVAAGGWRRWCAGRPRRSVWSCAPGSCCPPRRATPTPRSPVSWPSAWTPSARGGGGSAAGGCRASMTGPGRPERREFEDVRHGTGSLLAAMDVTAGTIHPKIIVRNDSDTFIEFLTELDQALNPAKQRHMLPENG